MSILNNVIQSSNLNQIGNARKSIIKISGIINLINKLFRHRKR